MRRLACLFFVSQSTFAQSWGQLADDPNFGGLEKVVFFVLEIGIELALLVLITAFVVVSVILYVMSWLIEKLFKSRGVSLRPSASTFIALAVLAFIQGIWQFGVYLMQLGAFGLFELGHVMTGLVLLIPTTFNYAFIGLLPAILVWAIKRIRIRRLPDPPHPENFI